MEEGVQVSQTANFAAVAITLYVSHHVGDYWVQTDAQAKAKGTPGRTGRMACHMHVITYLITQVACLLIVTWTIGLDVPHRWMMVPALAISGVTHYIADRRTPLVKIAGLIPGKMNFVKLGAPRADVRIDLYEDCSTCSGRGTGGSASDESTNGMCWDCRGGGKLPAGTVGDNPSLGTGLWALDQSWHIFWGVFIAGLVAVL